MENELAALRNLCFVCPGLGALRILESATASALTAADVARTMREVTGVCPACQASNRTRCPVCFPDAIQYFRFEANRLQRYHVILRAAASIWAGYIQHGPSFLENLSRAPP